jgi:phosphatidylserine decarboxylase
MLDTIRTAGQNGSGSILWFPKKLQVSGQDEPRDSQQACDGVFISGKGASDGVFISGKGASSFSTRQITGEETGGATSSLEDEKDPHKGLHAKWLQNSIIGLFVGLSLMSAAGCGSNYHAPPVRDGKNAAERVISGVAAKEHAAPASPYLAQFDHDGSVNGNVITVGAPDKPATQHAPATLELMALADKDPQLKALLTESIELARQKNPDKNTNPAQTLDEFYDFIDWASTCEPWNILKDQQYPLLYEKLDQATDYFYFTIDQQLPELEGKGLYNNTLQYYEPFRSWLINFTKSYGEFLSTPQSWNQDYYQKAYEDPRFGLSEGWYENPSNWKSFNDFFARRLASPDKRPIAQPDDPSVVVMPADSVPKGVWDIDANSNLKFCPSCVNTEAPEVKSSTVYSIKDLLKGSAYADAFANGTLTHSFLDVQDYHRYHFPVGGTVKEVNIIPQDDAVGGRCIWSQAKNKYLLDSATPGWQFIETRGYVIVDTEQYGLAALIPVGMSQISSVNFEPNVQAGTTFKKGDPLGYFLFGGSDFVILFQKQAGFTLTAPVAPQEVPGAPGETGAKSQVEYQHALMGEASGKLLGPEARAGVPETPQPAASKAAQH